MFDTLFSSAAGFQQAGTFTAGFFLSGLGALMLGNVVYWHLRAARVEGTIIGVRQKNRTFYPVYTYMAEDGSLRQATSDTSSSLVRGKETGRKVPLLVFYDDPEKVTPADSYAFTLISLGILAAGIGLFWLGLTSWPVTAWTWVMMAGIAACSAIKFQKYIIPKEERLSQVEWKKKKSKKWQEKMNALPIQRIEDIVNAPAAKEQQTKDIKNYKILAPMLLLVGFGFLYGGYHVSKNVYQLTTQGLHAKGVVVAIEEKYSHDSDGSSYTYYPIVSFKTAAGESIKFKDSMGSNPPMYKRGEKVAVLYLENNPEERAAIDRGIWNWLVPTFLFGFGALALYGAISLFRRLQSVSV